MTGTIGIPHEDQSKFVIISCSVRLTMIYAADKSCTENQNKNFIFSNIFSKIMPMYEIMWKNIVELDRPHMAIWCMCFACWVPMATNTLYRNT